MGILALRTTELQQGFYSPEWPCHQCFKGMKDVPDGRGRALKCGCFCMPSFTARAGDRMP